MARSNALGVASVGSPVGGATYAQKVLGYKPIAHWPLWEKSGTVARDASGNGRDGTYSSDVSVMGTGAGIGDGNTAVYFDGTNDSLDCFTASLTAAFDVDNGSWIIWAKVNAAAVWADGVARYGLYLYTDAPNYTRINKGAGANSMVLRYEANNVLETVTHTDNPTGFVCYGLTWDTAADEVRAYANGTQTGVTQAGLGVWAGALTRTVIGASNTNPIPANPWHGWIAHVAVWSTTLAPAQMADLARV
jgi:hypothetical protein